MKTTTRRHELLSTIAIAPALHAIIDDLAGLERLVPEALSEVEALALFRHQLPSLLELRGRGQAHTEQVRRLIGLIALEKDQVEAWIDVANALTILTNASNLALFLLPARSEDDVWAREQFGRNLLRHARRHGDGEDIALASRAVGDLPRRPAHISMPAGADAIREMIETMARRVGALQPKPGDTDEPDAPGIYTLEQAESLKAWFAAAPDLPGLLDSARSVLAIVDEVRAMARPGVMATDVIEGGLILAYARLIRVALWPARNEAEVAAKIAARDLVRSRAVDPDQLGALWEIAFGQGETVSGQSLRFLNVDERD